jgi:general secretion pathway protein H
VKGKKIRNGGSRCRFGSPFPLHPSRGFTLLEILIVVLLVGIITSFAVLSIGSRALDDRLDTEARRLNELFQLAADEAVLQGIELGFTHTAEGYAFLALKDGQWLQAEEGVLRPRPLVEPFYLQLRVEGRTVPPAGLEKNDEPLKPQVMLLSSGEATAFNLELRARDFGIYYRLEGDALGRIQLARKERPS